MGATTHACGVNMNKCAACTPFGHARESNVPGVQGSLPTRHTSGDRQYWTWAEPRDLAPEKAAAAAHAAAAAAASAAAAAYATATSTTAAASATTTSATAVASATATSAAARAATAPAATIASCLGLNYTRQQLYRLRWP